MMRREQFRKQLANHLRREVPHWLLMLLSVRIVLACLGSIIIAYPTNAATTSDFDKVLTVTKKVLRAAAEIGLDEAGSRLLGSAWSHFKKLISPLTDELERRYPELFLVEGRQTKDADQIADIAIRDLERDVGLQKMLASRFDALGSGQNQILRD